MNAPRNALCVPALPRAKGRTVGSALAPQAVIFSPRARYGHTEKSPHGLRRWRWGFFAAQSAW